MSEPFDELARKAALGDLTAAERAQLDAILREHPAKQSALEWDRAFRDQLAAKVESMPAMPGWDRTQQALAAAQLSTAQLSAAKAPSATRSGIAPPRVHPPGILDRLSDWFGSNFRVGVNMQAVAAALVLVQAGVIGVLAWQHRGIEYADERTGAATDVLRGPLLRVSFRPDVREAELRRALADIGGEIVGGPGQIGVYLVRVKDVELASAAERLRATGLTELVERYEAKR
ncbi:MAG: hypothetical protein ABIU95_00655 [Burkholderiales bacterium]